MAVEQLLCAWRWIWLLHNDPPWVETTVEPTSEQGTAHVAGTNEEQWSVQLKGHGASLQESCAQS
jgi:hypothetical protein